MSDCELNSEMITAIRTLIKELRSEDDLLCNPIIRDDVFSVLENKCIVLYYPLVEEKICGFHIPKHINGVRHEFVFINSAQPVEVQIFAAAHELGHIWKVASRVAERIDNLQINDDWEERIVGRFAAELLMPDAQFKQAIKERGLNLERDEYQIDRVTMVRLTVSLMNTFFTPYRATVKRLEETGIIMGEDTTFLLNLEKQKGFAQLLDIIIHAECQYTRLNKPTMQKQMANITEYIAAIEKENVYSDERIQELRAQFVVHPFVADHELDTHPALAKLI